MGKDFESKPILKLTLVRSADLVKSHEAAKGFFCKTACQQRSLTENDDVG